MYSPNDLNQEIRSEIEYRISNKSSVIRPDIITQTILNRHDDPLDDFYTLCAYRHVLDQVKQELNRFKITNKNIEPDKQTTLPGFERVQMYYLVTRNNDQLAVHVTKLTEQEIDEKIIELRNMAAGCLAHADELERFKLVRDVPETETA